MSLYDLATKLENLDLIEKLNEEGTTIDAIDFIPVHLGAVKAKILDLAKEKPDWNIEILENDDFNELRIEDRLVINVPKEHWDNFLTIFDGKLDSNTYLNLRTILKEAVEDDIKELRRTLKPALIEMFNEQDFASLDKTISIWRGFFSGTFITRGKEFETVITHERKGKDIQQLYGKLLRIYGDDKGNLEMLIENINDNRPLNAFDIFDKYDYLYGTRIRSVYRKVLLVFEATIDMINHSSQSIYIRDDEVLDAIEEEFKSVKRVGNVLYPVGGVFLPSFFRALKNIIKEISD